MAYTVDEVSDTLGVPRPTLYRYLREYSVPHLRRAGKIYVPEDSFDRIKEIRELHREGLDTESVRRRLQDGSSPDVEELAERLDRISETLEGLRGNPQPARNGTFTAQALQTVLARQTLLISEVSNLAEMLEELLAVNGLRRVAFLEGPPTGAREQEDFADHLARHPETVAEDGPATDEPALEPSEPVSHPRSTVSVPRPVRHERFGALTRRRRRGALLALLALLTGAALMVTLGDGGVPGASQEEPSSLPQEETPATSEEAPAESPEAPSPDSETQDEEESPEYVGEGYEDTVAEQPYYQPPYPEQEVAPAPLYQEQPVQQEIAPQSPYGGQPVPQPGLEVAPPLR